MAVYTVKRGDTLDSIARQFRLRTWRDLYLRPDNAEFLARRPNPDLIQPGDQLNVPDWEAGSTRVQPNHSPLGGNSLGVGNSLGAGKPKAANPFFLAVIDGTGERDDQDYSKSMQNSFCKQMADKAGKNGEYFRGPSWTGGGLENTANNAYLWLRQQYDSAKQAGQPVRLILAGYSRGGSAAIMVAERLEQDKIEVDSMFLFDAVARHHYSGGEVIPANVQFSRHARRNLNCKLMVYQYEGTFSDAGLLPNLSNPMRPSFGNTGLKWLGSGDHSYKLFRGSHGALGGVGWSFVAEDPGCQQEVAAWMNRELKHRDVPITLTSHGVPQGPEPAKPWKATRVVGNWLNEILLGKHYKTQKKAGKVK